MHPCVCALPSSPSISKFISDHPSLSMLENRCNNMKDLKKLHAQLIKTGLSQDIIAISRVLAFCATSPFGDINYAMLLFSHIQNPNHFTYNTIIRGFSQSSNPYQSISLLYQMLHSPTQPQTLTYPSVFKAYAQLGLAHEGAQLHGRILKLGLQSDSFIHNSLIFMYAVCGHLASAHQLFDEDSSFDVVSWNSMILGLSRSGDCDSSRRLFDKMPMRSMASWNSMISGYVRNGKFKEALDLFHQMQEDGIEVSVFTTVSLLGACAHLGALEQGEWIHAYIEKNQIEVNVIVLTAIIDMYCKCGCINKALQVFEAAPRKGLSSWNSVISGLGMHGRGKEAMELFLRLKSSLQPDSVSFLAILTACNHSGMVDEARHYFSLMIETYKIEPMIKHYGCMIDILGRAGHLEEAEDLMKNMPIEPDIVIWGSLLSAYRSHGNVEMCEWVVEQMIELDPGDSCGYVLLSNAYADASRFSDAVDVRLMMKEKWVRKEPGCSLIEVEGVVHEFVAGGKLHPQAREIYRLLDELGLQLKEVGCVEDILLGNS
ncbi:pentatricopeptide repeat-containing protein At2g42920, chloroplastic [Magnolia sinica]|uniref:pentatricopeptide repeat-containing protein At2g42920, chloroplastic n=1 Tax=Magnolia sinica TaxID=86752 RepID=UPI002659A421|nr:pentatricopeptide repeat-containing protein At2g42920, chloroplastic [Magnolia sinica]